MRKKILIVDNDPDLQELLHLILSEGNYETRSLFSGEQAIETIHQFEPHLVLLDVMVGDMDGRSICRAIKETPGMEHLPVILVSGIQDLSVALGQQGAPDDVISKPFDIDFFLEKVKHNME